MVELLAHFLIFIKIMELFLFFIFIFYYFMRNCKTMKMLSEL